MSESAPPATPTTGPAVVLNPHHRPNVQTEDSSPVCFRLRVLLDRHLRAESHGPSFPPGHLHALLGRLPRRHPHPDKGPQEEETRPSHQTKSTQTENPVLNLDESINRLSTEMSTLQDRLDHLEQERLEAMTSHRMQLPLANNTEYCSEEPELANHGQPTWPGAWPKYPAV